MLSVYWDAYSDFKSVQQDFKNFDLLAGGERRSARSRSGRSPQVCNEGFALYCRDQAGSLYLLRRYERGKGSFLLQK